MDENTRSFFFFGGVKIDLDALTIKKKKFL